MAYSSMREVVWSGKPVLTNTFFVFLLFAFLDLLVICAPVMGIFALAALVVIPVLVFLFSRGEYGEDRERIKGLVLAIVLFLLVLKTLVYYVVGTFFPSAYNVSAITAIYLLTSPLDLAYLALAFLVFYKDWFTYYVTRSSVIIRRDWLLGSDEREITFDKIEDVRVEQGLLAKMAGCGSIVFITSAGAEIGYVVTGGAIRILEALLGVFLLKPFVVGSPWNRLWDVPDPFWAKEVLMSRVVEWREVYQQRRIAEALEKMLDRERGWRYR